MNNKNNIYDGKEYNILDKANICNFSNHPKDLGLYIHIPFCIKKCDYCDFLSAPASEDLKKSYIDAVITEIESYTGSTGDYIVPTIFFGGGTPSCIDAEYIIKIMETINRVFQIDHNRLEATIEVNPGTVNREKLRTYLEAGINRLSFGLQSTDNTELKLLGRIHTYEQFEENYHRAREVGFHNINVDLMSALPGQTLASWINTLSKVLELKPEHISAYSLIIEEGTNFYERYHDDSKAYSVLPDEDTDREMYHQTKEIMAINGYKRYEISNYAKPSFECRHNSSYWIGTDYLGIGLGASSLLDSARFSNMHDINQYITLCKKYENNINKDKHDHKSLQNPCSMNDDPIEIRCNYEKLNLQQRMEEFMFLGLRMCSGISKKSFYQKFGVEIDTIYNEVFKQLERKMLIEINEDNIQLTDFGIDVSNSVLSVFLLN